MREYDFYVYMVRCKDGKYYTGVINDIHVRVRQHNECANSSAYVFGRRPVALVYSCHFENIYDAISWEKTLKRWSRKKKEAVIRGNFEALPGLASCKNESHYKNKAIIDNSKRSFVIPSGGEGRQSVLK